MTDPELEVWLKVIEVFGYLAAALSGAAITWFVTRKDRELNERIAREEREDKHRIFLMENRVEAYQEAYVFCDRLLSHFMNTAKVNRISQECSEWWKYNCLYLDKRVRNIFHEAFIAGLNIHGQTKEQILEKKQKAFENTLSAINAIEDEMGLPKTKVEDLEK